MDKKQIWSGECDCSKSFCNPSYSGFMVDNELLQGTDIGIVQHVHISLAK